MLPLTARAFHLNMGFQPSPLEPSTLMVRLSEVPGVQEVPPCFHGADDWALLG